MIIDCLNMIFKQFWHFKFPFFYKDLIWFFAIFSNKSTFLVTVDIKNGFSDSFPFQKCLYTSQLKFKSYFARYFSKFLGWHH